MTDKFDFNDGNGLVPAHKHANGGGWVADTAEVVDTVYVGSYALVYGNASVSGNVEVFEEARVFGDAKVTGNAKITGYAKVFEDALVYGNTKVTGNARVFEYALVSGYAAVFGDARVVGYVKVTGNVDVFGSSGGGWPERHNSRHRRSGSMPRRRAHTTTSRKHEFARCWIANSPRSPASSACPLLLFCWATASTA